ncbi:MAG: hypothetical protein RBU30_24475 [Polyangia bacterium]|jgi:hypothetical protein|nr:hypothetical protein [Polyangia bacterium]
MRRLSLVLVAGLGLCLAACGDDDSGQTNNNNHHMFFDAALQPDSAQPQPDSAQPQPDSAQPQPDSNVQPGNGITGDGCGGAGQCGGITNGTPECLTTLMSMINFPGGYCSSQSCTADTPCDNGNGTCVSIMGFMTVCLKACTAATECRQSEGYDCTTLPLVGGEETYCLPGSGMSFDAGMPLFDGGFGLPDAG